MSLFAEATKKAASARFKQPQLDAEGQQIEYDVREDEDQDVKLQESINLLLAAGYFRARIKGLSPFDKIVGGMTWCIQGSNFDVDVDLLFQENSTIGQKIALTEKIVAVLPRMKCPHRLEPHQIQGLDFISIYPVIQWLVKLAIETREETGDYVRAFSVSQFAKNHMTPEDIDFESRKDRAIGSLGSVKSAYKPQRRYRKPRGGEQDEEMLVHTTLLEYGRRYGLGRVIKSSKDDSKESQKKRALANKLGGVANEGEGEDSRAAEEKRIKALMKNMEEAEGSLFLSKAAVGSIVGLQSAEIQQMVSEYEEKRAGLEAGKRPDKVAGAQTHARMVAALEKQITLQGKKCEEAQGRHDVIYEEYRHAQQQLEKVEAYSAKIAEEMDKLDAMETDENREVLQQLRALVAMNENLKKQELQFKAHCKDEKGRLDDAIRRLEAGDVDIVSEEDDRMTAIRQHYQADSERLTKIKALQARKNREIALLQRKIDEVPSRTELSQYQRRFIELYNQVNSTLNETRQFYSLYNTLEDQKAYMEKEVGILSTIHEKFDIAMESEKNKGLFLTQVEQFLEGIKQDRGKLERKREDEKNEKDRLNAIYLELVEKQRSYYKTVRDFQEECRKNEILISKLRAKGLTN
ncbi:coiled-coil domain-containing protein 93-like [Halichondria panicea]|uniref:coiled-coil domain-containing protein 93-like n=1 Tax=Halichondria panicea TaxID=6063 RepID=UPI00312B7D4E